MGIRAILKIALFDFIEITFKKDALSCRVDKNSS